MDLRIAAIKEMSYHDYTYTFLYRKNNMNKGQISKFDMPDESKDFWLEKLSQFNNNWLNVRRSPSIFNNEIHDINIVRKCNLYFDEYVYEEIRKRLRDVSINFIQTNLANLTLDKQYDYMFLSNISDYVEFMFTNNSRENYCQLVKKFLENVKHIYFAYLYAISDEDTYGYDSDLFIYDTLLEGYKMITFDNSIVKSQNHYKDAALILSRK